MSLAWAAQQLVAITVLGLAASTVAALLVQDKMPFAGLRRWIWKRYPYPGYDAPAQPGAPLVGWRQHFGYLWTCWRCMGVWVMIAAYPFFLAWPEHSTIVAVPFAAVAVARLVNVRLPMTE